MEPREKQGSLVPEDEKWQRIVFISGGLNALFSLESSIQEQQNNSCDGVVVADRTRNAILRACHRIGNRALARREVGAATGVPGTVLLTRERFEMRGICMYSP